VHVRGRRSAGDLAISWMRRTRSGGNGWTASQVPLSEEYEAYEVDIVDGATVKRTIAVSEPAATYTAAQQIADFGATQASIAVRICQMSAVWGRGAMRAASI
jgi:hypothetical protein